MKRSELVNLLKTKDSVRLKFVKKDGTIREMLATLNGKNIPGEERDSSDKRKTNLNSLAVYDIENSGWRSFVLTGLLDVDGKAVGSITND